MPDKKCVFIPDCHGDGLSFTDSVRQSGFRDGDRLILLGDLVDRGGTHLLLFEEILKLQGAGAQVDIIMGNHELLMLLALRYPDKSVWTIQWMKNQGHMLLKEIAERDGLYTSGGEPEFPVELPEDITGKNGFLLRRWRQFLSAKGWDTIDFREAHRVAAREVFEGAFRQILGGMKPYLQIKDTLACHSIPNNNFLRLHDSSLLNPAAIDIATESLRDHASPDADLFKYLWSNESALSVEIGSYLSSAGVKSVIHGHRIETDGYPKRRISQKIELYALDVGMSHDIGVSPATWCFGNRLECGAISAKSSVGELRDME